MIYLIEQVWQDPMENYNSYGYSPIGYVNSKVEA